MYDVSDKLKPFCNYITPALLAESKEKFDSELAVLLGLQGAIHIDVCDGILSSQTTYPYNDVAVYDVQGLNEIPPDVYSEVHLMVNNPFQIGCEFARIGVKRLIAHREVFDSDEEVLRIFETWHSRGAEAGLCILFETPVEAVVALAQQPVVKHIQLMGISPVGAQGRLFDSRTLEKIKLLRAAAPQCIITVDGGMNKTTVCPALRAGANRCIIGSAIIKQPDPIQAYEGLLRSVADCA